MLSLFVRLFLCATKEAGGGGRASLRRYDSREGRTCLCEEVCDGRPYFIRSQAASYCATCAADVIFADVII